MNEFVGQMLALPVGVLAWIGFMILTMLAHFFIFSHVLAKVYIASFFLSVIVAAPIIFYLTVDVDSLSIAHWLVWPWASIYIIRNLFFKRSMPVSNKAFIILFVGQVNYFVSLLMDIPLALRFI